MPAWRRRLVACVTLVAFLATNAMAFGHGRLPFFSICGCTEVESTEGTEKAEDPASESSCKHCRTKKSAQTPETTSPTPPTKGEPGDSRTPSCPCQDHDSPSCPCPGGCIYCSVAKAPCHVSPAASLITTDFVVGQPLETPVVYVPLLCGEFFRPPRI